VSEGWIRADWPAPDGIVAGTTLRDSDHELPAEPQWLNQVHGTRVVKWGSADFDAGPPDADAIISDEPGSICVVRTADCLPVLLCSRDGSEIAAIHAGWRGLAAGVVEATLAKMSTTASDLIAWFGPAISQAAFEVGPEVKDVFVQEIAIAGSAFLENERGHWQADLYALARQRLEAAAVSRIFGGGLCTHADAQRFYSYRRDGETGRMLSFIYRS
jgi:YfiH family protein